MREHAAKGIQAGDHLLDRRISDCASGKRSGHHLVIATGREQRLTHVTRGTKVFLTDVNLLVDHQAGRDLPRTTELHPCFLVVDLETGVFDSRTKLIAHLPSGPSRRDCDLRREIFAAGRESDVVRIPGIGAFVGFREAGETAIQHMAD